MSTAAIRSSFCGFIVLSSMAAASPAQAQQNCPGMLYATGFDRQPTHGSKAALLSAVEQGRPLRVGWQIDFDEDGQSDLSHWSEAKFLSVWEGEVYTQVGAIHRQHPRRGQAHIELPERYIEWRGSMGSSGRFEGTMSDADGVYSADNVAITWCAADVRGPQWTLLYRSGIHGESLAGSKPALLAAIRAGLPIQIAWGFSDQRDDRSIAVEHLIAPVYVSIVDQDQVNAQLPEHIAQRSYTQADGAYFDDPAVLWRGLVSTTGSFDAVWTNRATGEEIRRSPQRAVFSWYAPSAAPLDTPSLAVPGGVQYDETRAGERKPR